VSDRIVVMYGGKIMEEGSADAVMQRPLHPYTQALFQTRPRIGRSVLSRPLESEPAVPLNPSPGCRFASRCPRRIVACTEQPIPLIANGNDHRVACIRA
jgi:oligopeptide/dipeptide ABC transporter ATP-binding protein